MLSQLQVDCCTSKKQLQISQPENETNNNVIGFGDSIDYSCGLSVGTSLSRNRNSIVFPSVCILFYLFTSVGITLSSRVTGFSCEKRLSFCRDEGFYFLLCTYMYSLIFQLQIFISSCQQQLREWCFLDYSKYVLHYSLYQKILKCY